MGEPLRVFVSYAREDKKLKDKLLEQLKVLERFRGVAVWTDEAIEPGEKWRPAIERAMATTDVAILLVSPSSLASGLIDDTEIPALLKRHKDEGLVVIPVILRDCHWKEHPAIEPFNVLPTGAVPIAKHTGHRRDSAFKEVAGAIAKLAKKRAEGARETGAKARAAPASALHQLRAPPGDFTGREAELADLRALLGADGAIIAGLTGQGGVGKTALALKLAAELRPQYPDAQIDIDLRGVDPRPLEPAAVMAEVIRAFDPRAELPEGVEALGKVYRSMLDCKRALLLFDNARDKAQVEPLVPPAGCLMLVTSRVHFTLPGLCARRLDTLAVGDAVALARSIAPRLDEATATELARLCGYLPLALRAAASALAERVDMRPARYLERLRGAERVKLVETVLAASLELLAQPVSAFFLRLGVMPADFDAAAAAAVAGLEATEAEEHLGELVRRSLLDWDAAAERYRMHDLARDYTRSHLNAEERYGAERRHAGHFATLVRAAHDRYKAGGAGVMDGLRAFDREWPHIAAAQAWAAANAVSDAAAATVCCDLPLRAPNLLFLRQHPRERLAWLESALSAARRSGNRADEGAALGDLGIAHLNLGETQKAITFYEQSLAIARELSDRSGEGGALGNLGVAYKNLGEMQKAIACYEQHLAIARELGERHGEGRALVNLSVAYANLGETQKAITYYEQGLAIVREIGDRRIEGLALGSLSVAPANLGEMQNAIECYEQGLAIAREIGDRRGEGGALGSLGLAYANLGETQKAIERYGQQLAITREIEDRRGEAIASWNLGETYAKLGDLRRAVELMQVFVDFYRAIGHRDLAKFEAELEGVRAALEVAVS
jgi:tetratricopeptide (TPR) repeat protein